MYMFMILPRLRAFISDTKGSMSLEAIIMFPLLFWAYVATFAFYDAYQARSTNLKASYTVADMLSRETGSVDPDFIDGLHTVFDFIANSQDDSWIRVTEVACDADCNLETRTLSHTWSYATDGGPIITEATVDDIADGIPLMPIGDRVLVVETFVNYQPTFNVGLPELDMDEFVVTRSRFTGQLCWEPSGECGED